MIFSQIDRQIVKSWREYALEPRLARITGRVLRNTGPRIAVIGNCQSFGIAYAMKLMDPSATVNHFSAIGRSRANMSLFLRTMETYDYVFTHDFTDGHLSGGGTSEQLRQHIPRTVLFPAIGFSAFHPDMVLIHDLSRHHGFVFGPIGPYHSALALFAWRKGLSLEEANALYTENVFRLVGYFDVWNDAARELVEGLQNAYGFDFSADLLNWSRRGVFMYSNVHPMHFVLNDVAKHLWRRVGLPLREENLQLYGIDDLGRAEVFPVYPPIAKMFGVKGSYLFKLANHRLNYSVGDFLTLPQYLSACYKTYAAVPSDKLSCARVDGWTADAAVSDLLVKMAKDNLRAGLTPTL